MCVCACVRAILPACLACMCLFGGQIIPSAAADKRGEEEEWESAGYSCGDFGVPNYKANNHGPSPLAG